MGPSLLSSSLPPFRRSKGEKLAMATLSVRPSSPGLLVSHFSFGEADADDADGRCCGLPAYFYSVEFTSGSCWTDFHPFRVRCRTDLSAFPDLTS